MDINYINIIYTGNDIKENFKKFMKLLLSNVISNWCMRSVKMINLLATIS